MRIGRLSVLGVVVIGTLFGALGPSSSNAGEVAETGVAAGATSSLATACTNDRRHRAITSVIWIWMENESYGSVIGAPDAPFETALARACGTAVDYDAISHPSLPNYLAATGGSTFGITDDGEPDVHPIRSASLFGQVDAAHERWVAYAESMPTDCDTVTSGLYAARHNPAVYYLPLRPVCEHDDVALGSLADGPFATSLRDGTLANFTFVAPNICDDAHSCPVAVGDHFLSELVPEILDSPAYRSGTVALFVTFDEGTSSTNQVPLVVASKAVRPGTKATAHFDHYSLLKTTEQLLGLPALGQAEGAASMVRAFDLQAAGVTRR